MKLSEIKEILRERDLKLSKSLGQNFLHDQNQIRRIVAASEAGPNAKVLEIGPGLGPLTDALLETGAQVLAIEKDQRLFDFLTEKFANQPRLSLLHTDALEYVKAGNSHTPLPRVSSPSPPHSCGGEGRGEEVSKNIATSLPQHQSGPPHDWSGWTMASNLPYSVASPILVELAGAAKPPERMVATLQLEVARRIEATTGGEHYGLLGLLLQLRYQCDGSFKIPASCFFPEPDVDSACVTLVLRSSPLLPDELRGLFTSIVKQSFSQRRKMMHKLLKQSWPVPALDAAFAELALSPQIRAEAVSLEQFASLTEILARKHSPAP